MMSFAGCARDELAVCAREHMEKFSIPVVAVTGSAGKTTVKDMIASVLSTKYKTFKSGANPRGEMFLPLNALKLNGSYEAAVFEANADNEGEARLLADIIRPDVCVVTNTGHAQAAGISGGDAAFSAKAAVLDYCKPNGAVVLNGDDAALKTLAGKHKNIKFFGFGAGNDFYADMVRTSSLWGASCRVCYGGDKFFVKIASPGVHMAQNALAAAAAGSALGLDAARVKNGIENYRPGKYGPEIINAPNGVTIINDARNANLASMFAALDVLTSVSTRKICVLSACAAHEFGGEKTCDYYYQIGAYAAKKGVDALFCAGDTARFIFEGARDFADAGRHIRHFISSEECLRCLNEFVLPGDTVLIKAFKASQFSEVAGYIENIS